MGISKKIIISIFLSGGLVLGAFTALADDAIVSRDGPGPFMNVTQKGYMVVRGAVVTSAASSTVMASLSWGSATINFVLNTDAKTNVIRQAGNRGSLSEIVKDHVINFEGDVVITAPAFTVNARHIRDWSVRKVMVNQYGVVKSIDSAGKKFVVDAQEKNRPDITVMVSDATKFMKQRATTTFTVLKTGDKVIVGGLWDKVSSTIQADTVRIQVEERHVFEGGRLKTIAASSTLPTSIVVTFGPFDYTVNIDVNTAVISSRWLSLPLASMKAGDHIRVYGSADGTTIAATVVRDVSAK